MRPIRSLVFICSLSLPVHASPLSDLASPSPEVRAQAAKAIRDGHLYHPSDSRARWCKLTAGLDTGGMTAADLIAYLEKNGVAVKVEPSDLAINGQYEFHLDDSWVLNCTINDSILTDAAVMEEPKEIRVSPPRDYTGYWRTYRVNGESTGLNYYLHGMNLGSPNDGPPLEERKISPGEYYPSDQTPTKQQIQRIPTSP
jgi:hypothetical protein